MRRAARRDSNELAIRDALESAACTVQSLSAPGVPDLLVGRAGKNYLLEIVGDEKWARHKMTGGLTTAQVYWHGDWRGQVAIVRTIEEALKAVGL